MKYIIIIFLLIPLVRSLDYEGYFFKDNLLQGYFFVL